MTRTLQASSTSSRCRLLTLSTWLLLLLLGSCSLASGLSPKQKKMATSERFKSIRSYDSVRSLFTSDEHLWSMVQQHHQDFLLQQQQHSTTTAKTVLKQQPTVFFVEFADRCQETSSNCHDLLRQLAHLDSHHVDVLSPQHAVITAYYHQLTSLLTHEWIEEIIALPAMFKVDEELWKLQYASDSLFCQDTLVPFAETNFGLSSNSNLRTTPDTRPVDHGMKYVQLPVEIRVFSHISNVVEEAVALEAYLAELQTKYGKDIITTITVHPDNHETTNHTELVMGVGNYHIIDLTVRDCLVVWSLANAIAQRHDVLWVTRQFPKFTLNAYAAGLCDSGITEVETVISQAFNGSNEVIGVADSGLDLTSCYFYDAANPVTYQSSGGPTVLNENNRKVIQYVAYADSSDDVDAHGTHVCGSVAGEVLPSSGDTAAAAYNGMSPGAKIAFFDIGKDNEDYLTTPSNINTGLFQVLYPSGARVFSNSWGTSKNTYESEAQQTDQFMVSFPDSLVLFAAGNNGSFGMNTVGSPATSKNALTVGAASNDYKSWEDYANSNNVPSYLNKNSVAFFSSQGPTSDGRMKPDILGQGYFVKSALGYDTSSSEHCDTTVKSGTSMATPIIAGMVVKVRQYFLQGYYPSGTQQTADSFIPSGALLKAVMVHSGQAMAAVVRSNQMNTPLTEYPSIIQGYGRVQLNSTLQFEGIPRPSSLFVIGGATNSQKNFKQFTVQGQVHQYVISSGNISASSDAYLRITLCYSDFPASLVATNAMVNILQVTAVGNNKTYAAYLATGTTVSNVQMIDIEQPAAFTNYTISITATTLIVSPQSYALVITGDIHTIDDNPPDNGADSKPTDQWYINVVIAVVVLVVVALIFTCLYYVCCKVRSPPPQRNNNNNATVEFYELPGTHDVITIREDNPMDNSGAASSGRAPARSISSKKSSSSGSGRPQRPLKSTSSSKPSPPKRLTRAPNSV